jgi:phosphatidylglycerol:prolipoprotein diacylglycerol transferase
MDIYYTLEVVLLSIISILVGGKLFYLIENWNVFIQNPAHYLFNFTGSTFYGGFILGAIVLLLYFKIKKIPYLLGFDSIAPSLSVIYGFGRIGCHLAGDGCYGIPTELPWGTNYENGTMPPSVMCRNTEIVEAYPDGIVPDNTPLHPTSVYEAVVAFVIFFILWKSRKKGWAHGKLFMLYLLLSSAARFLVEFIRLNPRILFGLSEAQLIALVIGTIGVFGFYKLSNKPK